MKREPVKVWLAQLKMDWLNERIFSLFLNFGTPSMKRRGWEK
ncbi:Aldo/keto reductase [Penicillium camemberti]|uniref:Aldo/keto reductase n=1 Tax=Penicillium camemberti (strain FM 013) TaxID=1429867 RepID=A0A0G4PUQ2_PENC3|nr:Aldo/keto reductase [Penicillium camemberti]